jgi:hypothetical protein
MNNIFGNQAVSGDDFFGRENFIKHLKGILLSLNSFLLLGLRRTGKSSCLKEVVRQIRLEKPEIVVIEINCQTYESIQHFYKNIYLALPKTWRGLMRSALIKTKRFPTKLVDFITDHIEEVDLPYVGSVKLRNDAISYAIPLKEELTDFFKNQNTHIILIIDELPFLFENIAQKSSNTTKLEIEMILTTLRSWRDIGISESICGSLNLHLQLQTLGISRKLLGGVTTQNLPKYTVNEAKGLLEKLAQSGGITLTEADKNKIIDLMPDCIPQFLQSFFFSLKTHWNGDTEDIKSIFDKYVYPVIIQDFEYQFNERFANLPQKDKVVAKKILHGIEKKPNISEAELLKSIKEQNAYSVLLLLSDQEFIVMNENQCFDFSFIIVRNWWKKKNY